MAVLELDRQTTPQQAKGSIPRLENGDTLDHNEYMRRYEAMPGVKAERIDGVVYMASPVRLEQHGEPHSHLVGWLVAYQSRHPDVRVGDNATVFMDLDNDPQPDACLLLPPDRGGRARLEDGYVVGPPELICEVAASTASLDANQKAEAYHRAGVPEYLLWRTEQGRIDWMRRTETNYRGIEPDADGLIESTLFPGLRLDREALLRGDMAAVLRAVLDA